MKVKTPRIFLYLLIAAALFATSSVCNAEEPWRPVLNNEPLQYKELGRSGAGRFESVTTPQGEYFIVYLRGTHAEMGEQYGELLASRLAHAKDMFKSLAAQIDDLDASKLHFLAKQAWALMKSHVPEKYKEEMAGISRGAEKAGEKDADVIVRTALLISNLSDGYDIPALIGLKTGSLPELREREDSCSFFAVWGKRSEGGKLFASRDLDWNHDTGLSKTRLITIYDPVDENGRKQNAYATFGYMGFIGAISGMNDHGIAMAEVGATNNQETLRGTPWTLLFREVLEGSKGLADALAIVKKNKNTIGYNWMVADGDADNYGKKNWKPSAVAIETNSKHTVIFHADDPVEKNAVAVDSKGKPILKDGKPIKYGFTLTNAIFRGDAAMSPEIRRTQTADNGPGDPDNDGTPYGGSYIERYKYQYEVLKAFETGSGLRSPQNNLLVLNPGKPVKIGVEQAAIAAGTTAAADGNIMSVIYSASDLNFWLAYESGTGKDWKPAPQSGYVHFNLRDMLNRYRAK